MPARQRQNQHKRAPAARRRVISPAALQRARRAQLAYRRYTVWVHLSVLILAGLGLFGWWQHRQEQIIEREFVAALAVDEALHPQTPAPAQPKQQPVPKKAAVDDGLPDLRPDVYIPPIENGLAPVISRLETKQPVVFLGIDDGVTKRLSDLELMRKHNIKASLYLTDSFVRNDPMFFAQFTKHGSLIENHSMTHKLQTGLGYEAQKTEICDQADRQEELYGRRPVFFRPPGGNYNESTRRAAAACGMKAIVLWIAKANGGSMQYQVGGGLRAGDIVLMHFRPEFPADMQAYLDAQKAAGLQTVLLNDWLAPESAEPKVKTDAKTAPE